MISSYGAYRILIKSFTVTTIGLIAAVAVVLGTTAIMGFTNPAFAQQRFVGAPQSQSATQNANHNGLK